MTRDLIEPTSRDDALDYRAIAEALPSMVAVSNTDGTLRYVNALWHDYTGLSTEEINADRRRFVHPADLERVQRVVAEGQRTGEPFEVEYAVRRHDGAYRRHLWRASPMRDDDGDICAWIGTTTDIEDQRRIEGALTASENRFRTIVDTAHEGVWTIDRARSCNYVNEQLAAMLGLTREQMIGRFALDVVAVEDRDTASRMLDSLEAGGSNARTELRLRCADGSSRATLISSSPLYDDDGTFAGALGVVTDLSERKRTEHDQRFLARAGAVVSASLDYEETMHNLARLLVPEIADVCAIDVLQDGAGMRRLDVTCADPGQQPIVEQIQVRDWLIAPGDSRQMRESLINGEPVLMPVLDDAWLEAVASNHEQFELARQLQATSAMFLALRVGDRILGAMSLVATRSGRQFTPADLRLADQVAIRAAVAIENARLYARVQATAEELRVASAAKDEFLGLVSHELRTPITTILGNAEVLERRIDTLDRESRDAALRDIRSESQRLHRVVDNLLVLARTTDGRPDDEPLLLTRIVDGMVREHLRRHPERVIDVITRGKIAPVIGRAGYVELVLRNLISNAGKYGRGSPIDIEIVRDGAEVQVTVLDRGLGVGTDEAERIFEPFYRSPGNPAEIQGLGLGLAVCRRLMERLDGRIWQRNRDGGGSGFGIALPIAEGAD